MKVIFLDFDGTLVMLRSIRNKDLEAKADQTAIAALNRVIAAADAKIAVGSTWRSRDLGRLRECLML